ncbi:MAG: hypothetical protein HY817_02480 [Candidatus Abawacabacteria bacterium]|nr:hypothetical protein [Candidatus Abawacabacteria bacterium]
MPEQLERKRHIGSDAHFRSGIREIVEHESPAGPYAPGFLPIEAPQPVPAREPFVPQVPSPYEQLPWSLPRKRRIGF